MRRLHLLLMVLTGLACIGFGRAGDQWRKADLSNLNDPKLRDTEVARLLECDGKERKLVTWRLHLCPQTDGTGDLHILAADTEYDFQSNFSIGDKYEISAPEELFGKAPGVGGLLEPSLARILDHQVLFLAPDGNEIHPFGSDDSITHGYLFDFNGDGILELADFSSSEVRGADDHEIQVFELATIEREPKKLLQVIFNWHHEQADEINEWGYTCYDEEGDGRVEIAFGPKTAATDAALRQFVFRWDPAAKRYSAGEIPEHSHIRVMQPGETMEQIAKAGGLNYPLEGEAWDGKPVAPPPATRKPYNFKSLNGASDAELLAFCRGKKHRDSFDGPEDAMETALPPGFWEMSPKDAALAFAEANRTSTHRRTWKLAIDDRDHVAPPKSGWWLHDWSSSGCYSFSKHIFALRFGVDSPVLIATDYNSQGAVGRNPLADQPGSTARLIPLSEKEASFLADTLFWLDRIRSNTDERNSHRMNGIRGSTADGFGSLYFMKDGATPRKITWDTVWAGISISSQWDQDYTPQICLNLVEYFLDTALPAHLSERWKVAPEIDRRSLMTPLDQRLTPRHDTPALDQLTDVIGRCLDRHFKDPIPAPALADLVDCIGQEAFLELQPALERLKASLPVPGAEDKEFEALDKRFGLNGTDEASDHRKVHDRYQELQEKRELAAGPVLREPVDRALEKLRLAVSSKLLLKEVRAAGGNGQWALDRLRRNFPELWKDHLIGEFQQANLDERKLIFNTLAAASPRAAKDLLALISPKDLNDLVMEVAEFQIEHDPDAAPARVPVLMEIVRHRTEDYVRRGEAMTLLGRTKLSPSDTRELMPLLLAELKDPQTGDFAGANTYSEAIEALSRLPGAAAHLDEITRASEGGFSGFDSGIDVLLRLTEGSPDRLSRLEAFVTPCLHQHDGMMNGVFLAALALDLRGLAPRIAEMATEGPAVADGDGADYGGGRFNGPAFQRYHAAREVTALWSETDPATRARLWIASIVNRPYPYESTGGAEWAKRLGERAAETICQLPRETRSQVIGGMIAASPGLRHYPATTDWLRGLAEK
ncbi:hypothetical protein [Luteolibacter soli]